MSTITCSITLRVKDKAGILSEVLAKFKSHNLNLTSINSTTTKDPAADYEFTIQFNTPEKFDLNLLKNELESEDYVKYFKLASSLADQHGQWFPKHIRDLDTFAEKVLSFGMELDADHPGFKDPLYRKRRSEITDMAKTYRTGMPLPHVNYTADELKTWSIVYTKLTELFPTHACFEHQQVFPLLVRHCGYGPTNIPQIQDISVFLKSCTGFTLRPVMGLLSSRDFLNGLAFRVFHSTQYIRHASKPFYTPEPDVCHELLGHVPMFADPDFADFSQEIGLASLGVSDDDIKKLATLYWFTVEFGVTKEGDKIKAYGAGLLSSFGELEYAVSDKPKHVPMEPFLASQTKYPITEYQPLYYVTESFKKMKQQVREFSKTLSRSFGVRYNPYTESIEVLDRHQEIVRFIHDIHGDMEVLLDALDLIQI